LAAQRFSVTGAAIADSDEDGFSTLIGSDPVVVPAGIVKAEQVSPGGKLAATGQVTVTAPEKPPLGVRVIVELAVDIPAPATVLTGGLVAVMVKLPVVFTVKRTPLLATPPTVTTTLPVVAPVGTGTTILVALQFAELVGFVAVPLKVTVLVPWVAPKFVPVIVTDAPTAPEVGFRLVMLGAGAVIVNVTAAELLTVKLGSPL